MACRPAFAQAFAGRWRIDEMDTWPDDVLDVGGEPRIVFIGGNDGEIAFVAVEGFLDVRYGARDGIATAEFTFEGFDEGDPVSGRGWASLGTGACRARLYPRRRGFRLRLREDLTSSTAC